MCLYRLALIVGKLGEQSLKRSRIDVGDVIEVILRPGDLRDAELLLGATLDVPATQRIDCLVRRDSQHVALLFVPEGVFNINGGTAPISTALATRFVPWRPR